MSTLKIPVLVPKIIFIFLFFFGSEIPSHAVSDRSFLLFFSNDVLGETDPCG